MPWLTLRLSAPGAFARVNVEDRRLIADARDRLAVAFRILRDTAPVESAVPSGFQVIAEAPTIRIPVDERA